MSDNEDVTRRRLYWHSRRGMWELDLLLMPFLEDRYDQLTPSDQVLYRELLANEDQDLFTWLMRREWPRNTELRRLVKMIVEHAETTDNSRRQAL
ncbi:succinate dehydrogenase assembly factor 2 [Salinicola corii]|uniref:FAD assembly factor SdhE n=1 Tax=Salinicola corii TaxID=2606937 RepID=A0A640WJT4_9GAMM|nr:succinate dehydrogenase assembly factor 2 [Salinicola corii]KAA0020926.1 succinate dehydrogenase assembly factor 2 [Salinicola corii]